MATSFLRFVALFGSLELALAGRVTAVEESPGSYCTDTVPGSKPRNKPAGGHDCKCPRGQTVSGMSVVCTSFESLSQKGRKFSSRALQPFEEKGCYCRQEGQDWAPQDAVLVGMLKGKSRQQKQWALGEVLALTTGSKSKDNARQAGVLKPIIDALLDGHLKMQRSALLALKSFTTDNEQNAVEVGKAGATQLMNAMLNEAVQDLVIQVIMNLVTGSSDSKLAMMKAGAVDSFFELLRQGDDSKWKVAADAIRAIASEPIVDDSNIFVIVGLADRLDSFEKCGRRGLVLQLLRDLLVGANSDALTKSGHAESVIAAIASAVKELWTIRPVDSELLDGIKALTTLSRGDSQEADRRRDAIIIVQGLLPALMDWVSQEHGNFALHQAAKELFLTLVSFRTEPIADALMASLEKDEISGSKLMRTAAAMSNSRNLRMHLMDRLTEKINKGTAASDTVKNLMKEIL